MTVLAQRAFAGGEISPTIYGRPDQTKYQQGLRTCRNMMVMRHGGVTTRPGTKFIGEVPQRSGNNNKFVQLVPFKNIVGGEEIDYFFELGEGIFHVWRDNLRVADLTRTITGISNAGIAEVTTSVAHGFSTGDVVTISGVVGMEQINTRDYIVGATTANTLKLNNMRDVPVSSLTYGTYSSGGTVSRAWSARTDPIWTGITDAICRVQHFHQRGNTLYITHETNTNARVITKNSATDTDWTLNFWSAVDGPSIAAPTGTDVYGPPWSAGTITKYVVTAIDGTTLEESRASSEAWMGESQFTDSRLVVDHTAVSGGVLNVVVEYQGNATTKQLTIESTANETARVFNIIYWDSDNALQLAAVNGPNATRNTYPAVDVDVFGYCTIIPACLGTVDIGRNQAGRYDIAVAAAPPATNLCALNPAYQGFTALDHTSNNNARAWQMTIEFDANNAGRTVTFSGTDKDGAPISEKLTEFYADVRYTTVQYFATVTAIVADAAWAGSVKCGVGKGDNYPAPVHWNSVTGASEYNIYKAKYGVFGFIGVSATTSFTDDDFTPDYTQPPPTVGVDLTTSNNRPQVSASAQQRLWFANTPNDPEIIHASQIGNYHNFDYHRPHVDSDAITFRLVGRKYGEVRHIIDLGKLVIMTSTGEWVINSDGSAITPTQISATQHSHRGSAWVEPAIIGGNAVFLQRGASVFRDLGYQFSSDNYTGNDLTVFSSHLFDKFTFSAMGYQQTPHSVIWAIRSDGKFLGLTYLPEHQIWGWHRHDFYLGTADNLMIGQGPTEDAVYFVVKRTIAEDEHRYIEQLSEKTENSIQDWTLCDSALTYDGYNGNGKTLTITGGTLWDYTETLTVTASSAYFTSAAYDVGNQLHFTDSDGNTYRFDINGFTSTTVVTGKITTNVPAELRSTAIPSTQWAYAVDELINLWHLEGCDVSVLADNVVESSPFNPDYSTLTVTDGQLTLSRHYAKIQVGLPITSDFETLDIDSEGREAIVGKTRLTGKIAILVESSRGMFIGAAAPTDGTSTGGLLQPKISQLEGFDDNTQLITGVIDHLTESRWDKNARIFIRQVDPVPLTILSVAPYLVIPGKDIR